MSDTTPVNKNQIGTLKESSLHAALKEWYFQQDDIIEQYVKGYYIDIVRGSQLIEIQTSNFSAITTKISILLNDHSVHLVYPLVIHKWIKKITPDGEIKIRKSPKKGRIEDIFWEVVKIPKLIVHPNFTYEVLLVNVEETWTTQQIKNRRSSWRRRGWTIQDRHLIKVVGRTFFCAPGDYNQFLETVRGESVFSTSDIARVLGIQITLARKMIYTLKNIGIIRVAGKKRNAVLYIKTASYNNEVNR